MKINPGKGTKSKKPPYHYTNKQTNGPRAITLKPYKMKNFESHKTFENQDIKVEINFFGLVKVTKKRDGTWTLKNDNISEALKYWTKYFNEESKRGNHQVR